MSVVVLMLMSAIAVTSGTAAMALYYKYRQDTASLPALPAQTQTRHPTNLRPNDVVEWLAETYVVRTVCTLTEGSQRRAYLVALDGGPVGGAQAWLHAAPGSPDVLAMLTQSSRASIPSSPPSRLTHEGASYKLDTWSQYTVTQSGPPLDLSDDRTELYTYRGPGELVVLAWVHGSEVLVLEGRVVEEHHIDLLPGDEIEATS